MTEKELSRYFHLKKEIKDLKERLAKLGDDGIGGTEFTDMPKGMTIPESVEEMIVGLREKYIELRVSALEEYIKIETYINTKVDDPEIRNIMRKRFLDLWKWEDIGREYHSDRTTVSKKCRKYIEKLSHNSRQVVLL